MNVLVSGLVNVETSVKVRKFPIEYYPIDYPFFGVESHIAGVAYNLAKALTTLGDDVDLLSFRGEDEEANRIERKMRRDDISVHLFHSLKQTPVSVVLYDDDGRRQIYCDLKDIQEKQLQEENYEELLAKCDVVAACNISFNRPLLRRAKELGKMVATDVHVLSDIRDEYNQDFLKAADILFLSDEGLPCTPEVFLDQLSTAYPFKIGVIGLGSKGAMLYDREKDEIYHLAAAKTKHVVNTVGAGDALFSAFVHFFGQGMEAIPALERAQIFAAKKISFSGASVGFPYEAEVEEAWRYSNHHTEIVTV